MKLALVFAGCAIGAAGSSAWSQTTFISRASLGANGNEGNSDSVAAAISADGRFVAFASASSNLVPGDTNTWTDVFVRDRLTGQTSRVSVDSAGSEGNSASDSPSISANGRYVAFSSSCDNLVSGDTNGWRDVFVHDRLTGQTTRVSVDSNGTEGASESYGPSISADGRYVAFESAADNLVAADTNGWTDVFVHDRSSAQTTRASVDSAGNEAQSESHAPSISADGRWVAFESSAGNLVAGDTNAWCDVFLHDRLNGQTSRVSLDSAGSEGHAESHSPALSADGSFIAFDSVADNLVPGDTNGWVDVFVHDRVSGQTRRVSVDSAGNEATGESQMPSISPDASCVSFHSSASDLVQGDTNGWSDIFVHDRLSGVTRRASVDSSGTEGDSDCDYGSALSSDARYVAFTSSSSNLVAGDTNGWPDVFVCDRLASGFTTLCDPGAGGVIACPCANPPAGSGRGCDNSSFTGGAVLSASGTAYLASDSLVFTTVGEKPTAPSILLQGSSQLANGANFGQGVRCAGGQLKRLFIKIAAGGSIHVPDPGAGDPTISARSAALGDVIQAGQSRWYQVYYRDPVVLGGCPATSTYNATQTGRIDWAL